MGHSIATIRHETSEDVAGIRVVVHAAFGSFVEANLVDGLRRSSALTLSGVAVIGSRIVGHVAFSPITIGEHHPALALAPLAVAPDCQRQGIGAALIRWGLDECRRLGHEVVLVLGDPGYYSRFGFTSASHLNIECPFPAPPEAFMALELIPGAAIGCRGMARYRPEFESVLPDDRAAHNTDAANCSVRCAPWGLDTQTSYDRVADEYVRRIFDELQHKPLDRQLLDRFAASVGDAGLACDMGCGPGHVARYLHEHGVQICGVDLSAELVAHARRLTPGVEFRQGDMMALDMPDETWAGIAAFYSIIHIPRADIVRVLRELRRVLRPGGLLLLSFHIGDETIHLDDWWGEQVCVDFFFFRSVEMAGYLTSAGFEIEETIEREPYPDVEHQSRRSYIFARRPRE